jgi:hypothetical protein
MSDSRTNLESSVSIPAILGYLNFSEGKPDSRFQKQLNEAYAMLAQSAARQRSEPSIAKPPTTEPRTIVSGSEQPLTIVRGSDGVWQALHEILSRKVEQLKKEGGGFQDARQAEAALALIFDHLMPAYRRHHQDLLAHLSDTELFQPFLIARMAEAVLAQGAPWQETERIIAGALNQLNDYVGYRPIAILETRPKGEPYNHERGRPIPLYIRGAGVAWGRYQPLIERTIQILQAVDPGILGDASFDLELLDELALDPRAYDQSHPAGRPRNYVFGEWDPHHLDNQGRYRRFIVRDVVLEALMDRVKAHGLQSQAHGLQLVGSAEALFEAAAVLAGTILMASGICGSSPTAYDSTMTLSKLIPRIAKCREAFYDNVLSLAGSTTGLSTSQAERLRQEAAQLKQPLGGARQHLNEYLARHRAAQFRHRHLAMLYAEMGFPDASRQEAAKIPAVSVRIISEIWIRLTTAQQLLREGQFSAAAKLPAEIEALIRRGIDCGALPDPWNILGFQGMFPLSAAQEDSIRDPRIDDLLNVMEHLIDLYSRLLSESAGSGKRDLVQSLTKDMRKLAGWWDQFASVEVQDVRRVHGGEALASAEHLAQSMARWHEKGKATGDLAFWKQYLEGFRSPKSFILVIDALLRKNDYRAAMALLITWLNQVEQVPLEDGGYSFHIVALRWMMGATSSFLPTKEKLNQTSDWALIQKFFDYLEANAEDYWDVPDWEMAEANDPKEENESPFAAAYEGITYRDTADDDTEGPIADGSGPPPDLDFEREAERVIKRLRFVSTVARLWQIAAWRCGKGVGTLKPIDRPVGSLVETKSPDPFSASAFQEALCTWLSLTLEHQQKLLRLMESIFDHPIPEPMGSYDSMVEYDRRRLLKEHLLHTVVATGLDSRLAAVAIRSALSAAEERSPISQDAPQWEPLIHRLVQSLLRGDSQQAREVLPAFVQSFQKEPLLFPALTEGGHPRQILRVRIAQTFLRTLLGNLPRLGLLREAFELLKTAWEMERANAPEGSAITEFNHLFQAAYQAVVETIVTSSASWPAAADDLPLAFDIVGQRPYSTATRPGSGSDSRLIDILEKLTQPFLQLWMHHSQTLRVSVVEKLRPEEWQDVRRFIERHGRDLFHARFMTLANLRGILRGGIQAFFDFLRENPDPLHPVQLIDDIETEGMNPGGLDIVRLMQCILEILVENYDVYLDYNTTSPRSDYGENLHVLLDFLRLKATYERHAWQLRPLEWAHEVLVRKDQPNAARIWRHRGSLVTSYLASKDLEELDGLEKKHGLRLASISDLLQERFEMSMEIDRLCALVEPAINEADSQGESQRFADFQRQLDSFPTQPGGAGVDLPIWLRRLEQEVQRVRSLQSADALLSQGFVQVAQIKLSLEDVQRLIPRKLP